MLTNKVNKAFKIIIISRDILFCYSSKLFFRDRISKLVNKLFKCHELLKVKIDLYNLKSVVNVSETVKYNI